MAKGWQPDGWRNPYRDYKTLMNIPDYDREEMFGSFEAGADAMLEALRAEGMPTSPFTPNVCELFDLGSPPDLKRQMILEKPGRVVFIPDEAPLQEKE